MNKSVQLLNLSISDTFYDENGVHHKIKRFSDTHCIFTRKDGLAEFAVVKWQSIWSNQKSNQSFQNRL